MASEVGVVDVPAEDVARKVGNMHASQRHLLSCAGPLVPRQGAALRGRERGLAS
jgi:hypothetical protein